VVADQVGRQDRPSIPQSHGFRRSHATVIGISDYRHGITRLKNAHSDASAVASQLTAHGYQVTTLVDQQANLAALRRHFAEELRASIEAEDRLLVYFAGHGVAFSGDGKPEGFLIPADGRLGEVASYYKMQELNRALHELPCRHLLLVLDCCFAGSFRWSGSRAARLDEPGLYFEHYQRFTRDRAWQVITSAASDEEALDFSIDRRGSSEHSPFAAALLEALDGRTPVSCDHLITATKLYVHLRDLIEKNVDRRQTPGLFLLEKHDKGEFLLQPPGREVHLQPAPPLDPEQNPYRGLASFDQRHAELFFGRKRLVAELLAKVEAQPVNVVMGASGAGKSSLVKAGVLPLLAAKPGWVVAPVVRLGEAPRVHLRAALAQVAGLYHKSLAAMVWHFVAEHPDQKLLVVIDQLEELRRAPAGEREAFWAELAEAVGAGLRILATLPSHYEPLLPAGWCGWWRFAVRPMTHSELRDAIEQPARMRALSFEPQVVDEIISEVGDHGSSLPLVSYLLSELYLECAQRGDLSRTITEQAYRALAGVRGAIAQAAQRVYDALEAEDPRLAHPARHVVLRMVELDEGGLTRRRAHLRELVYGDADEDRRVIHVLDRFVESRLLTSDSDAAGPYVEPAHDAFLHEWKLVDHWLSRTPRERTQLRLQGELSYAARNWDLGGRKAGQLWNDHPKLSELRKQMKTRQSWINALEKEFIGASRRRQHRLRLRWILPLALLVAALVGFPAYQHVINQRQTLAALPGPSKPQPLVADNAAPSKPQPIALLAADNAAALLDRSQSPRRSGLPPKLSYAGTLRRTDGSPLGGVTVELVGADCKTTTSEFGAFRFNHCEQQLVERLENPRIFFRIEGSSCRQVPLLRPPKMTEVDVDSDSCGTKVLAPP
jgi:hypothetical protein